MHINEINMPVQPDTYEASMALSQLLKIGQHSIKLHNLIKNDQEMESWVAKKIDLAGDYVKKVYNYTHSVKAGMYEDKECPPGQYYCKVSGKCKPIQEDAGEGHMSKSTLYHTAKYAIALMQLIKKGDDLEGWVQSKLNKAADYLQGAYNYEEYQKLNPYREDLDGNILDKHSEILKKHIDEILDRETKLDDTDTKPGMMRILGKKVNEVEKKMAREYKTMKKPRTIEDYKAMMKAVQDVEKMPQIMKDPEMKAKVKQRKMQLQKDMPVLDKEFDDQPRDRGQRLDVGEDKYEFRGNPFPILGKAESYLNYGSDMAKAILNNSDQLQAMAKTYLDRVPSFVDTEMKEIFPRSENANEYADKPRQMKDPSKEVMMQKNGKVIVVDKDKEKEYMSKGYELAETLDEGVKDWARNLAAAGIIVGAVAGLGSINNAIDNSVPAIQAMNTALELAQDQGNTDLADMIKKDIRDAKLRLDIGKDLNQVKYLQDKYSKFMPTEGLAYESKLAVLLNQHLK
jgi:23S rRNA pseudoU1915 N3-methylase RlmH